MICVRGADTPSYAKQVYVAQKSGTVDFQPEERQKNLALHRKILHTSE
jgi:hypothetical protein